MFTILSFNLSTDIAQVGVQIHGHYENRVAIGEIFDQVVKRHLVNGSEILAAGDNEWRNFANGVQFGMVSDENTITIWEKYGRPGRLYGETPKKRLTRVFQKVAFDGGVMAAPPPIIKPVVTRPTTTGQKQADFANVVVELKEKLAKRRSQVEESMNQSTPEVMRVNPFYQLPAIQPATKQENLNQLIEEILSEIRIQRRNYVSSEEESEDVSSEQEDSEQEDVSSMPMDIEPRYWNYWETPVDPAEEWIYPRDDPPLEQELEAYHNIVCDWKQSRGH